MTGQTHKHFVQLLAVDHEGVCDPTSVEGLLLGANDWVPNNQTLPVLLYRNALACANGDAAGLFEAMFERNRWPAQWRNGIYRYHHYHSTAHEVLGIAHGWAQVVLGGPNGHEVRLEAGDVALLPAGTGHCLIEASEEFLVVGGYPEGPQYDVCRAAPTREQLAAITEAPFPDSDPVTGAMLASVWKRS